MADLERIKAARDLLARETPLAFDCGTLCGHKCCTDFAPDQNLGVYLIPGELPLFDGTEAWAAWEFHATALYEFAPSWARHGQIPFLKCTGLCAAERDKRPFECRTYPLVPYRTAEGALEIRYAPWAEGVCPLVERYRLEELRPSFVAAVRQAWELLMEDPEMLDHVCWLSSQLKDWAELPHTDVDSAEPHTDGGE